MTYFLVVNLAEQIHRIRRRRDYLRDEVPQAGSWIDTFQRLKKQGFGLGEVEALLARLCYEPVFTAHPTEARRRTLLLKELEVAKVLVRRLDPSLTPPEEKAAIERIRAEVTAGWQTDEHPDVRPSVGDERDHVLYHLTDVIQRVVPPLYEELEEALAAVYGPEAAAIEMPEVLRFASWVGGDMDGNPNVSAATLRSTLGEHRERIVQVYRAEVRELSRQLSQTRGRAGFDPELLAHVDRRLAAMLDEGEPAYPDASAFEADLRLVLHSLEHHRGQRAGAFAMRRLLRRVATFGFHLATVDVRQDSQVHRQAMAELLGDGGWTERAAAERTAHLRAHPPAVEAGGRGVDPDSDAGRTLEVFRAIAEARARGLGPRAIGPYIISMAQAVDDVLTVLWLARRAGLVDEQDRVPLDVAPLFETVA
ncbi:MAG: phosphoenolpyruvate carboxylase, partial [Holophagales bacterium]|nr:phosphoenolpyruvate carboxylase [Holophagales bacterium]